MINTIQWYSWLRRRAKGAVMVEAMGSMRGTTAEPVMNAEFRELPHDVDL